MNASAILEAFRELPQPNRLELLGQLWDQLVDDGWTPTLDDARKAELDRRWEAFRADPKSGFTWDEVVAHARRSK